MYQNIKSESVNVCNFNFSRVDSNRVKCLEYENSYYQEMTSAYFENINDSRAKLSQR